MDNTLSTFASRLCDEVLRRDRELSEGDFDSLARELFGLQFAGNHAYRVFCESRGVNPGSVKHWTDIPVIPTAAFKELELTCVEPRDRTGVFHSSGTTGHRPSRHFHSAKSLAVYEASLWPTFKKNVLRDDDRYPQLLILTPPPAQAPCSSLVHMFEVIRNRFGAAESRFTGRTGEGGAWVLGFDAAIKILNGGEPTLVLGTAFSIVHLMDHLNEREIKISLPAGSRVMETGGYKGRSRVMERAELHSMLMDRLAVPASDIICEYGMSELSSQAYAGHGRTGGARIFHFPSWARVRIVSPESGREAGEGEIGLLRVFDLANVFSVMALQTEDLAVRRGTGFELVGRAAESEPRGCSLMAVDTIERK